MIPKPAGYSGTPLARKLGLKQGMTVRLLGAPERYWDLFGPEVGDLDLVRLEPEDETRARFTHLFATTLNLLRDEFNRARAGMTEDGMVWASWPKKSSGVETEVGRSDVMREGKAAGLVDVKVCAVDETWSGLKFVIPVAERKGLRVSLPRWSRPAGPEAMPPSSEVLAQGSSRHSCGTPRLEKEDTPSMTNGRRAGPILAIIVAATLASAGASPAIAQDPGEIRDHLMADLVYTNGIVVTLDSASTVASSIAIKGDRIIGVGNWSPTDIQPFVGPHTRVYDLEGRTVIPGLQDSHLHFIDLGGDLYYVARFDDATSVAEVQRILREHLEKLKADDELDVWTYPGTGEIGPWIFGAGWNQGKIPDGRMATRQELDEVSREVPISLDRVYRGIAVNTRVFELMGYDFDRPETWPGWFTEDPDGFGPGDIIGRDPDTGLPNGVFYGSAPSLVRGMPSRTFEQDVESVARGAKEVLTRGIVSVVDPSVQAGNRVYQEAYNRGLLPIRVTTYDGIWTTHSPERMAARFETYGLNNLGDLNLKIRGIKLYGDGGAGSRSAAVSVAFEPIPADPMGDRNFGSLVQPDFEARLAQFRTAAVDFGWELHTHSIGDVTMRQTTDGYKIVMDEILARDPDADLRYSIIHAYMADEPGTSVIRDMADYGIIASINPADIHVEGDSFLENLGAERMARLLPFRTYLENGVIMASGSDYSVAPWDPWIGIYAMRTRRLQVSGEVMGPDQTIPLQDALESYTINGAYLNYEDHIRGSLERGKLADLVVIDADLLNVPDDDLRSMGDNVLITMVGGRVEYRSEGFELPEVQRDP